jgi:8-oxo-dGTP pyrophosphatase MutT (NUDIX family)
MALQRSDAGSAPLPVRDAATLILVRDADRNPSVLMGQRGKTAAFMPDKYVFPGGAVDETDAVVEFPELLSEPCRGRLAARNTGASPDALAAAAIRELWEETGLRLGRPGPWKAPEAWRGFSEDGLAPDASALRFFFRAVTPPGRPRRFDARFFLADASTLADDPDDFSGAEDELSHLHWVPLDEVRALNLPFITRIVLGELQAHLPSLGAPKGVPFVTNDVVDNAVIWL